MMAYPNPNGQMATQESKCMKYAKQAFISIKRKLVRARTSKAFSRRTQVKHGKLLVWANYSTYVVKSGMLSIGMVWPPTAWRKTQRAGSGWFAFIFKWKQITFSHEHVHHLTCTQHRLTLSLSPSQSYARFSVTLCHRTTVCCLPWRLQPSDLCP